MKGPGCSVQLRKEKWMFAEKLRSCRKLPEESCMGVGPTHKNVLKEMALPRGISENKICNLCFRFFFLTIVAV